jgi:hypothetical protein
MFDAESLYVATLKLIDERIALQKTALLSRARKSSDADVQAAAKTLDSLTLLKEEVAETWKGQQSGDHPRDSH